MGDVEKLIQEAVAPLLQRIEYLEACTDEWVKYNVALRLTGIKSPAALQAERKREGTIIEHITSGSSFLYSRASCIAFAEQQRLD